MKTFLRKITAFINDEAGASAVEYGLLVGLIAVAIIVAVTALGNKLAALFAQITAALP
jgi:pilus assembly protein Flp/PilA